MTIRKPLRPLAHILSAPSQEENLYSIERDDLRRRNEKNKEHNQRRSEFRLVLLGFFFVAGFIAIGVQMGLLAATPPEEPKSQPPQKIILSERAEIIDRNGRILATNILSHALYAHPKQIIDPKRAAKRLSEIFPKMEEETLIRRFSDGRRFIWLTRKLSPQQMQAVHDIGDPGLLFASRYGRLYPNGELAAHILGSTTYGLESIYSAEVTGISGIEESFNNRLLTPGQTDEPLELSLDITIQATVEDLLQTGMQILGAKGAAAIVLDVHTGEVISLASLPGFDPNNRPVPSVAPGADPSDSPLFNRAVQGVYELGSTFKIFTVAQALELGLLKPDTMVDANAPMRSGEYEIKEFEGKNYGPKLSVTDAIVKSSNVATANIALMIGSERQQAFLKSLGLFDPVPLEKAQTTTPLRPSKWLEITTITASYGHGISVSPLHLAVAYSAIANGGKLVLPTLLKQTAPKVATRVMSEQTAKEAREMLRQVVTHGTASLANIPHYEIAGKTGTADKPKSKDAYYEDKVINTFAAFFPVEEPQYVIVVTLYEPVETSGTEPRRTAGWTSVPVATEIIRRIGPLLNIPPVPLVADSVAKPETPKNQIR